MIDEPQNPLIETLSEHLGTPQETAQEAEIREYMATKGLVAKDVDIWLNEVNYADLNSGNYVPSTFALKFINFIKLVNGEEGEQHESPVVHLKMLDEIAGPDPRIANLCARGMAKTTLMFEYLILYVAVFGEIDGFGNIDGMIYVSDSMDNGVKSARKNIEFRYHSSEFLLNMVPFAKFTDNYLEFKNQAGHQLGCKMFGAKTGLRGTKIFGKRPVIAVLDDLVSDDDSKSAVSMEAIKDTVYKGVDYALDPQRRKIIFNGTPFNKNDILYEAVESGGWKVNVYPICERFPCSKEEFQGAWEDRFTYEFVKDQYMTSVATGKVAAFQQELMLRISSAEEKLVQESEIRWFSRQALMKYYNRFNFYITTDFATKAKQSSDYSVISVWAYNALGDWHWVDGICKKQTMDKNINDLFSLAQQYRPQAVGLEISGQQGAFIDWIQGEMMRRNVWFTLAAGKNGQPGINPTTDKLSRFNLVVPLFKAGKIKWPTEMKSSEIIGEFMSEINLATLSGLKSKHDDCLDTISMLMYLNPWKPSEDLPASGNETNGGLWDAEDEFTDSQSAISSYIV